MRAKPPAWRPLTRVQVRRRIRARVPGGPSLFDSPGTTDTRTPEELEAAHRAHLAQLDADERYRAWCEMAEEIAHAHLVYRPDGTYDPMATEEFYDELEEREERERAGRVTTTFAAVDDPATRARAVGIIRELIARAEARR